MSQTGSATQQEQSEDVVLPQIRDSVLSAFILIAGAVAGWASPASSKLLALVPDGAQIVAGIEDPHSPTSSGRLLLVTHSCNLDFNDWVAMASVDPHREADEVIEVATSSSAGELKEHLVLVAGRFDREHIFRAAFKNGALLAEYRGQGLLVVQPFARERQEMNDSRWMAILDDRITIFGAPELVRQALDRYMSASGPDPMLVKRLRQIHPDVNSWDVLVMSGPMLARHVDPGQLHGPWNHILDGADELTVGIHYGSTDRIDFAVHAASSETPSSLVRLAAAPRLISAELPANMQPRLRNLSIEQGCVRGSFLVPGEQFQRWLASIYAQRSSRSIPDAGR
jgi:hypothetical protein